MSKIVKIVKNCQNFKNFKVLWLSEGSTIEFHARVSNGNSEVLSFRVKPQICGRSKPSWQAFRPPPFWQCIFKWLRGERSEVEFYFRSLIQRLTRRQWKNWIQELLLAKIYPTSLEICCKIGMRNFIWEVERSLFVCLSLIIFLTKNYTHGQLRKHTDFQKIAFSGHFPEWRQSLHLFSCQEWIIQRTNKRGLQKHSFIVETHSFPKRVKSMSCRKGCMKWTRIQQAHFESLVPSPTANNSARTGAAPATHQWTLLKSAPCMGKLLDMMTYSANIVSKWSEHALSY